MLSHLKNHGYTYIDKQLTKLKLQESCFLFSGKKRTHISLSDVIHMVGAPKGKFKTTHRVVKKHLLDALDHITVGQPSVTK